MDVRSNLIDGEEVDLALLVGREGRQDGLVRDSSRVGASELVSDAGAAEGGRASSFGVGVDGEDRAGALVIECGIDVFEDVALNEDVCAGFFDIEGVASVVRPVVVEDVPEAGSADLGGTAGGRVDVVVGEGDLVVFAEGEAKLGRLDSVEPIKRRLIDAYTVQ